MKPWIWLPTLGLALTLAGCEAEQTAEGDLPDVEVEGGELPEYDVEPAELEVTADTQAVVVPEVEVRQP